jgi:ATP-binding cassette subfamily B protein
MPPRPEIPRDAPKGTLKTLPLLFRYLSPHKGKMALACLGMFTAAITVLALGQGMKMLVDKGFAAHDQVLLQQAIWWIFALILLMAGASFTRSYTVSWLGERLITDLRRDIFAHLLTLSPRFYDENRSGEIVSRLTADATLVQTVVSSSVPTALRNIVMFTGGAGMLAYTSFKLTALVFCGVPLVLLPIMLFGRKVRTKSKIVQEKIAEASAQLEESLSNIRTVQAFSHEANDHAQFCGKIEESFMAAAARNFHRALLAATVISLVFGAVTLILWIGGQDVIAGNLSAGNLTAFVFYAVIVASSIGAISEIYSDLQKAAGATERLMELKNMPSDILAPNTVKSVPQSGQLTFQNMTFQYPVGKEPVLRDITLAIKEGEKVALVGRSGAGKSTLFHLALRFYDPQHGAVLLDGINVRDMDPVAYRRLFALVSQEPAIFATSVMENIRYGNVNATDAEIIAASKAAFADEFVSDLPQGYDTYLGERGVRLSGGQKQRVAIARALLRRPKILLLDEATSALDSLAENKVQQALELLGKDCTVLTIAHRLSTVQHADRLIVLENGTIAAEGTHNALLQSSTLYQQIAAMQFTQAA